MMDKTLICYELSKYLNFVIFCVIRRETAAGAEACPQAFANLRIPE
jgi:hypothetical protein